MSKENFDKTFCTTKNLFGPEYVSLMVDNILIHPNTFLSTYEKVGGDNKRL